MILLFISFNIYPPPWSKERKNKYEVPLWVPFRLRACEQTEWVRSAPTPLKSALHRKSCNIPHLL